MRTQSAAATSLLISSLTLDALSTGWATASAAGTVTWSGPRNLTRALLDTAVGGGGFTDATAYGVNGFTAQIGRSVLTSVSP